MSYLQSGTGTDRHRCTISVRAEDDTKVEDQILDLSALLFYFREPAACSNFD